MLLFFLAISPLLSKALIKVPLHSKPSTLPILSTLSTSSSLPFTNIPVSNYYNLQYYAYFNFGTPAQEMSLILDTGSSWTWIPSANCSCHLSEHRFSANLSSSYQPSGNHTTLYYGQGVVGGELGTETIEANGLVVEKQDIIVSYLDKDLDGLAADGLLGLGFNQLSDGRLTFIENLKAQGQIDQASFSIYLSNDYYESNIQSAFIIGGHDETYGSAKVADVQILQYYGFWLTVIDEISIEGARFNESALALLDIGSSFLYCPNEAMILIKESINKVSRFEYDSEWYYYTNCTKADIEKFPRIKFTVEGTVFEIGPQSYLYYEQGTCYLFAEYSGGNYWILGQVFFREFYTVYDMDNTQVSLYLPLTEMKSSTIPIWVLLPILFIIIYYITSLLKRKSPISLTIPNNYIRIY